MLHASARRTAVAAFAAVACLVAPLAAGAGERRSAMVIDANTGAVLYDRDGDALRHPASLTKMMTLYMTFELIEMGRLSYDTPIKVTAEAAAAAPSKLELEPGETIRCIDAIKALVTKSANDMAIALAQHIGGSEQNFARLMTEKARQLGMRHTVFRNASGLPNDEQLTTARDMITLGLHLQDDFPKHYPLFGLRTFAYNGGTYRNHNTLLLSYRGTDGIKTGYTRASGFNLVANVRRDGRHVIGAIFGGESAGSRNAQLRGIFDRVLPQASTKVTRKAPPSPLAIARRDEAPKAKSTRVARAEPPAPKPASRPAPAKTAPAQVAPAQVASAAPSPPAQPAAREAAPPAVAPLASSRQPAAPTIEPAPRAETASAAIAAAEKALAAAESEAAGAGRQPAATATAAPAAAPVAKQPAPMAAQPAPVASAPAAETPPAAQPAFAQAGAGPSISLAKVHRVMVAPHVSRPPVRVVEPTAPGAAAPHEVQPAGASAPEMQPTRAAAVPTAPSPAAAASLPSSSAVGAPASTFSAQVSALAANMMPAAAERERLGATPARTPAAEPAPPVAESAAPQLVAEAPPVAATAPVDAGVAAQPVQQLGRAPSTLGAQADAIAALVDRDAAQARPQQVAAAVAPPTYRLKGPPPAAAAPSSAGAAHHGAFQIQIGAFSTEAEAGRQLANVQSAAGTIVGGHAPLTLAVAKSNRTLYRARFASFDANSAAAACLELRRQQIDCFVMKAE